MDKKIIKKQERMNKLKTMALIASLIALHIGANAQTLTPQQNKKSKWGYVNEAGKAVIKHKYDNARAFSDGLAAVNKGGYWGLINEAGKEVLKCKYNEVRYFSEEGVAIVRSRINVSNGVYANKFGVVDKTGSFIVPLEYDTIRDFSNGVAVVKGEITVKDYDYTYRKYERWGMIDKTGTIVIPLEYTEISEFSDDLLKAKKKYYWIIINKTGKIIATYTEIGELSEGLARVKSGNQWGYIDKTGKIVIPVEYDRAEDFSEGFARVAKDNTGYSWGVIDKTGKQVLPFGYSKTEINSMPLSAFVQKEVQRIQEEEKQRKLEEEIKAQKKAEILAFFEEVEPVLDNDYYSADSHSSEVLKELMDQLKTIEDEISFFYKYNYDSDEYKEIRSRSSDLDDGLRKAYNIRVLTENYGVATAKKIMAGRFEIGMSKIVCKEVATVTGKLIKTLNQTTNTELWKAYGIFGGTTVYLHFTGDKLVSISY